MILDLWSCKNQMLLYLWHGNSKIVSSESNDFGILLIIFFYSLSVVLYFHQHRLIYSRTINTQIINNESIIFHFYLIFFKILNFALNKINIETINRESYIFLFYHIFSKIWKCAVFRVLRTWPSVWYNLRVHLGQCLSI